MDAENGNIYHSRGLNSTTTTTTITTIWAGITTCVRPCSHQRMERAPDADRPRAAPSNARLRSSRSLHVSSFQRNSSSSCLPLSRSLSSKLSRSSSKTFLKSASLASSTTKSLVRSASKSFVGSASKSLVRSTSNSLGAKPRAGENPWGVTPLPSDNVVTQSVSGVSVAFDLPDVPSPSTASRSPSQQLRIRWKKVASAASATFQHARSKENRSIPNSASASTSVPRRSATAVLKERPACSAPWRAATFAAGQTSRESHSSSGDDDEIQFVVEEVPSLHDDDFVAFSTASRKPKERLRDIVRRVMARQPPALRKPDRSGDL